MNTAAKRSLSPGSSYYYSTLFLPPERRQTLNIVYAFKLQDLRAPVSQGYLPLPTDGMAHYGSSAAQTCRALPLKWIQGIVYNQGGMIGKTLVLIDSYPHYPIHERRGRHLVIDTPADVFGPRLTAV